MRVSAACRNPAALADGLRLTDCATDNIVRAEEVTFLGHPLSTVKQADMDGILLENGFEKSPDSSSEYAYYSKVTGDGASYTGYTVYPNAENGASVFSIHGDDTNGSPRIGIRNIAMRDLIASVLEELGFSNGSALQERLGTLLDRNGYDGIETAREAAARQREQMADDFVFRKDGTQISIDTLLYRDPASDTPSGENEAFFLGYYVHLIFSEIPDYQFHLPFFQEDNLSTFTCVAAEPASQPELILSPAVKYVPYSEMLPDPWTPASGGLPSWLSAEGGALSGVPTEAGSYTVRVTNGSETRSLTLTVRENGDNSVRAAASEGYEIVQAMPDIAAPRNATIIIDDAKAPAAGARDISAPQF